MNGRDRTLPAPGRVRLSATEREALRTVVANGSAWSVFSVARDVSACRRLADSGLVDAALAVRATPAGRWALLNGSRPRVSTSPAEAAAALGIVLGGAALVAALVHGATIFVPPAAAIAVSSAFRAGRLSR